MNEIELSSTICRFFLTKKGLPPTFIDQTMASAVQALNPSVLSLVMNFLQSQPDTPPETALEKLWPAIETMGPMLSDGASDKRSMPEPLLQIEASKYLVIDNQSGQVEPPSSLSGKMEPWPSSAIYPHMPPQNIDLHLDMPLKTGIFRVMKPGRTDLMLDPSQIFQLSHPLASGYTYMTLSGPVLNTDMELVTYMCLMHWFGRLSKDRFELAISKPLIMSRTKFLSPIPDSLYPKTGLSGNKLLISFERIKSVVLTLYKNLPEAEARSSAMIANLAGTLTITADDEVAISPTPELRALYLNTKKLVPINRSAVIGLSSPMARLLALWIAAKPGRLQNRRVYLKPEKMQVKSMMQELNHKCPVMNPALSGSYNRNDCIMLANALQELMDCGLVEADIEFRNVKSKRKDNEPQLILTPSSFVTVVSHCIGDASTSKVMEGSVKSALKLNIPSTKIVATKTTALKLQNLKMPVGCKPKEQWMEDNQGVINEILADLHKAAKTSPLKARQMLAGVYRRKLVSLASQLLAAGKKDESDFINQLLLIDPRKRKTPKKQSEFETLLRSIPPKSRSTTYGVWYKEHEKTINQLKKILRSSKNPLGEASSIHRAVYFSRLVKPFIEMGKKNDADFFKGMFEGGREADREAAVDAWNAKRRRG